MKSVCVAGFGEIMLRLCPPGRKRFMQGLPGTLEATYGGGEANVCASLAMLGSPSRYLTALPPNPVAKAFAAELRGIGVDVEHIAWSPKGRMGVYYAEHGAAQRGSNVVYDREGSTIALLAPEEYDFDAMLDGVGHLHITGITPALSENAFASTLALAEKAAARGIVISCDLNFRKKLWNWQPGTAPRELAAACMGRIVPLADWIICNEEDAADGEPDRGPEFAAERGGQDVIPAGFAGLPRPDLAQGADHEADQQGDGEVMDFFEQPAEHPDEGSDADHQSEGEKAEGEEVLPEIDSGLELVDRVEHVVVLAEQQQDERTGNTGENHGADGGGAAEDEIDVAVGRVLEQGEPDDDPSGGDAAEQGDDGKGVPFADAVEHAEDGGGDQPEKESPEQDRLVPDHPVDGRGEQEKGSQDAEAEDEQERPRQGLERLLDLEGDAEGDGFGGGETFDRIEEFLINSEDERHGSAGDAGNDIGGAHDCAGEIDSQISGKRPAGFFLLAHVNFRIDC